MRLGPLVGDLLGGRLLHDSPSVPGETKALGSFLLTFTFGYGCQLDAVPPVSDQVGCRVTTDRRGDTGQSELSIGVDWTSSPGLPVAVTEPRLSGPSGAAVD